MALLLLSSSLGAKGEEAWQPPPVMLQHDHWEVMEGRDHRGMRAIHGGAPPPPRGYGPVATLFPTKGSLVERPIFNTKIQQH